MKTHYPTHHVPQNTRAVIAACAMLGSAVGAFAADPLYRWNFDNSDGANTGTGTGGALTANVGGATTGSFAGTGVSGAVGDSAFQSSNGFDNWFGTALGNAAAVSDLDLSALGSQFTVSFWVKRDATNIPDLINIGSTATPNATSDPGLSFGFSWNGSVRVGINGLINTTGDLWSAGNDSDWVFLAFAYDGSTGNAWWSPAMNTAYGFHSNGAIITGTTSTSASVTAFNMTDGNWEGGVQATGIPSLGSVASIFLANNAEGTTGFSGGLDDIRIYSGLLTLPEIEAIRLEAAPAAIPEPSSAAFLLGGFGMLAALARRPARRR